jgi:hypothetical protein
VMVSRPAKLVGLRLHLTSTTGHGVGQWMLVSVSHRDGEMTPALFEQVHNLWVLGDNTFRDPTSGNNQSGHVALGSPVRPTRA